MTDPIARLKTIAEPYGLGLSYSDLSPPDQRLIQVGAVCAAALLWFAVALVQPWLVLVMPVLVVALVALIRRRRAAHPDSAEVEDDWSF